MAICKGCGRKYSKWTTPVSARGVCRECFESELENESAAKPQQFQSRQRLERPVPADPDPVSASADEDAVGEKAEASLKWTPPPGIAGFLPRSNSKTVFILVMACYGFATSGFIRTLAAAFNAPAPPAGLFTLHGRPTARAWELLLFAPIVESLILIGTIELFRRLRAPAWTQVAYAALVMGFLHSVSWQPWGFIVAPAFAIQALAYLIWRSESRKVGFAIVACIHALLNLMPAISVFAYGIRHA
ncbi:MAG: hypothetical protein QOH39_2985 [Verrucomicrobiota bacterium]|jgi:hypothetical protein